MSLRKEEKPTPNPTLLGTALAVAPAAVGCAVGLLLADRMKKKSRQSVASALFTLGALATVPLVVDYVSKTIDSPSRKRGSNRRLEGIRQGGADSEIFDGEEYFLEEDIS